MEKLERREEVIARALSTLFARGGCAGNQNAFRDVHPFREKVLESLCVSGRPLNFRSARSCTRTREVG